MQPVALNGGDAFITDELWLVERGAVQQCIGVPCSVEVGEISSQAKANVPWWFWAEVKPNGSGYTYDINYTAPVAAADMNKPAVLQVAKAGTNLWQPIIGTQSTYYTPKTTDFYSSPMKPNSADAGAELYGLGGARAPTTTFTTNQYADTANTWHYENCATCACSGTQYAPMALNFTANSYGGVVTTSCCELIHGSLTSGADTVTPAPVPSAPAQRTVVNYLQGIPAASARYDMAMTQTQAQQSDVVAYLQQHQLPGLPDAGIAHSVVGARLMAKQAAVATTGQSIAVPDGTSLWLVTLQGRFEVPTAAPEPGEQPHATIADNAWALFDAQTGNLLAAGCHG